MESNDMSDITSYVYFTLVYGYLQDKIDKFGLKLMEEMMSWATALALTLVTLWILAQGFRVMTGRSHESLMELVVRMGRVAIVVSAATTMAITGTDLKRFLTTDLDREVHFLFTQKKNEGTSSAIDRNLAYTAIALSAIDSVKVLETDQEMIDKKSRTAAMATFGTAGPPMVAGAMLLLYQFAMALFTGLGPLFILCLLFEQTKDLFRRWLLYGIGTVFSMALLSAVSGIVLDLMLRLNAAMWGAKLFQNLLQQSGEGLSGTAIQQGGIGLLLSVLIASVPPMAAAFFQGTLGNALTYSVFSGGRPGPQGQPVAMEQAAGGFAGGSLHPGLLGRFMGAPSAAHQDVIKSSRTL